MDRFIEIKNLVKIFYGRGILKQRRVAVRAVDKVSFGIERNTVFGLVGESGCGKTTLVRSVLYLDPPTSGEVWFDGKQLGLLSTRRLRSFRKRMQIVFQDPNSALNPKMRIEDSLAEGLVNLKFPVRERSRRIKKLLDLVGIAASHRSRYPHEFSGGQKQRIVIARALCMEPDFLVLDEPVSNLDVSIQAQIINLLLDLKEELSLTYLFISHDLNLVAYFSDRIGVMYKGRLVEMASTEQMMNRPRHPYTLKLFSSVPGRQTGTEEAEEGDETERLKSQKEAAPSVTCPYAVGCAMGDRICSEAEPELKEISSGHRVACFKV
ncbi:MAG: ABC transporter ATP-binding protein [Desulfobacterales bacterium]|nr:MAG: ABC transporter ATP-binding protein [Desulfobacterales bacterium]